MSPLCEFEGCPYYSDFQVGSVTQVMVFHACFRHVPDFAIAIIPCQVRIDLGTLILSGLVTVDREAWRPSQLYA